MSPLSLAMDVALFAHLVAVVVWVGGKVFAQFCLRPAFGDLSPQLRLPLIESVFGRFFNWIGASIIAILISGGFLMSRFGGAHAPWQVTLMAALGVAMMLIFGHVRFAVFPPIRRAVQAQRWPDGARAVDTMRRLVLVNLLLGLVAIVAAVLARGF